jgi:ABC-type phosphate transport system substrate-binding protein
LVVAATLFGALAAAVSAAGSAAPSSVRGPADAPAPVALTGDGTWGALQGMNAWGRDLFGAPTPVNLQYLSQGGALARQEYVGGTLDYFVSGLGPTAGEQAALAKAHRGLVAIPLQSDALGLLLLPPSAGFSTTATAGPYTGPIRMPLSNLAQAFFLRHLDGSPHDNTANPVDNAWIGLGGVDGDAGVSLQSNTPAVPPEAVVDLTPGESTSYLELFFHTVMPAAWDAWLAQFKYPAGLVSESWPVTQQIQTPLAVTGVKAALAAEAQRDGALAPLPPWAQQQAQADVAGRTWQFLQIQNAAGGWVAPTPATVQAAIVAGGGQALSALTSPEAGAYPLSWVDSLYAPTSGLSVEKTNALATFIRYAVTGGRAAALATGTIPLPDLLVPQALKGADDLVRDNCTGQGVALVSTTDPGPFAPTLHALDAVGPRLMCQALVGPGSAPGGGTPGGGAGSPDANSAASLPGSARSADGAGAAGSRGDGSATVVPGAFASGPLVAPGGLSALTQLTTPGQALPPVDAGTNPARSGAPTSVPAARLLFGLPFSGSHRTDTPVTLALGALAFWSGYRSYVRRRRRGA